MAVTTFAERALTRRRFLGAAASSAAISAIARPALSRAADRPLITHGIQSGDVSIDSAVVWARADRPSRMLVEVATSDSFSNVRSAVFVDALPETDFTANQVHLLVIVQLQIDHAVLTERGNGHTSLRVECQHPVARRDVDDPGIAPVAPVREPTARELPWSGVATRAFVFAVHPQHLAGAGVEGNDSTTRSAGRIDNATDHERR